VYKSRRAGRPPLTGQVVSLIVRMSKENPTWSRRRIAAELAMLGWKVSKDTVAPYMTKPTPHKSPSTNWATGKVATERRMRKYFLGEHLFELSFTVRRNARCASEIRLRDRTTTRQEQCHRQNGP
jgi:hypothetical protein